jgi:hypothetical protein
MQMGEISNSTKRYHNDRHIQQQKIEKNQGREYEHHQRKNPSRCGSIHYKHDLESKRRVVGMQENPTSIIRKS